MVVDLNPTQCGKDLDEVFHLAKAAALDNKSSREVVYCWDMLQIWHDWIDGKFGSLKILRHRSQPDDPPDIQLVFESDITDFEHTRLQPYPLGWAEAIKHTEYPELWTAVPALSKPPKDRRELEQSMLNAFDAPWADAADELRAVAKVLVKTLREKMIRLPHGGIIGIVNETCEPAEHLFEIAEYIVNSKAFSDFVGYTLIMLDRPNPLQYCSAIITRENKMETRSE